MNIPNLSQNKPAYSVTRFERFIWKEKYWLLFFSFVVAFLLTLIVGIYSSRDALALERQTSPIQVARELGIDLYLYANDHGGKYPKGNSSTEIFQQLVDKGYITDTTRLYYPMAGKTKAIAKILKPENVCWDVTDAVSPDDPDSLPLVFLTGYKIKYVAGGKPFPLANAPIPEGIAICYKSNAAKFISTKEDGPPLIDPTFDPKGKTYRQLTPDGPLP